MIRRVKATGVSLAVALDKKILKAVSKFTNMNLKNDDKAVMSEGSYWYDYNISTVRQIFLVAALKQA